MQDHRGLLVVPLCGGMLQCSEPRLPALGHWWLPEMGPAAALAGRRPCGLTVRHHHHQHNQTFVVDLLGSSHQRCSMKTQKLVEQSVALHHSCPVIPMVRTYRGKGGLHLALLLAMGHCACYTTLHNARHWSRSLGTIFENPCESRRVESLGSGNKE